MSLGKKALVLGGNGALGRAMVASFQSKGWKVLNVDLNDNEQADGNIIVKSGPSMQEQISLIYDETNKFSNEYGSIVCTAGGFQVSHIMDTDILEKYLEIDK